MSDVSFHLNFPAVPDQPRILARVLRQQQPLSDRLLANLLGLLGYATGSLFLVLVALGVGAILLFLVGALTAYASPYLDRGLEMPARVLLFSLLYFIVALPMVRWLGRRIRSASSNGDQQRQVSLLIDVRGIIAQDYNSSSILNWSAVDRVLSDKENIYLFLGTRRAFVIPRTALDSPAAADRLISLAERSRSGQVSSPQFRSEWVEPGEA